MKVLNSGNIKLLEIDSGEVMGWVNNVSDPLKGVLKILYKEVPGVSNAVKDIVDPIL